jgi:hypothetical protein
MRVAYAIRKKFADVRIFKWLRSSVGEPLPASSPSTSNHKETGNAIRASVYSEGLAIP